MDKANSRMSNSYRTSKKRCSMGNYWSISISSNPIIGNISNISIITISIVSHMLGTTIRKSNRVRSNDTASSISRFSSIKARTRIVIIDSVGVGVWVRLIRVDGGSMSNYGMCKNRGICNHWSMGNSYRVSNTMESSSTMETVRSISHGSNTRRLIRVDG